jgi:hypothetical protein
VHRKKLVKKEMETLNLETTHTKMKKDKNPPQNKSYGLCSLNWIWIELKFI